MKSVKKSIAIVLTTVMSVLMVFSLSFSTQAAEINAKSKVGKTYKVVSEKYNNPDMLNRFSIGVTVKAKKNGSAVFSYICGGEWSLSHYDSKIGDYDYDWFNKNATLLKSGKNKNGDNEETYKIKIKKGETYHFGCVYYGSGNGGFYLKGKNSVSFKVVENTGWVVQDDSYDFGAGGDYW